MTRIEKFISHVEVEIRVAETSGIFPPDPEQEQLVLERLNKKFPELGIDLKLGQKILLHARAAINSHNN